MTLKEKLNSRPDDNSAVTIFCASQNDTNARSAKKMYDAVGIVCNLIELNDSDEVAIAKIQASERGELYCDK